MRIGEDRYSLSPDRVNGNVSELQSQLSAAQQEKSIFESEIKNNEINTADLENTRTALQEQLASNQEAVSSAQTGVSSAQSALTSASNDLSSAQSALQSAESIPAKINIDENGKIFVDTSERDAAVAQAQAQLSAAQESYEAAQADFESAQRELESLQKNATDLENQISQIDSQLQGAEAEQQSASDQLTAIEAEYAYLESQLQEAEREMELAENSPAEPTMPTEPTMSPEPAISPEEAVKSVKGLSDDIAYYEDASADELLDEYMFGVFSDDSGNNDAEMQTVEDAMLSAIEAELEKQQREIETEADSKSGLGKLWNSAKGLFGGGTQGELNDISELRQAYSELKSNPNNDAITALYTSVFGEEPDMAALKECINTAENLKSGSIVLSNGEAVTQKDIASAINEQVASLASNFDDSVDSQGFVTKLISGANNFVGIGTTENMTKAQLNTYQELADKLAKTNDPEEFASLYKSITGEELTSSSLDGLFEGSSKVENSKAVESMMDYEETNENIKNTAVAVGVGIATAATGGVAGAVAIGVGATVAVNTIDAVTQDNCQDIAGNFVDYAKTDMLKDVFVGAINGLTGKLGNMAGEKLVKSFAGTAGKGLTAEAAKATLSAGKRVVTEFVDGAVDAGLSSAAEYIVDSAAGVNGNFTNADGNFFNDNGGIALFDNLVENFDAKEMLEQTAMSTIMGGVMSAGMQEGIGLLSKGLSSLGKGSGGMDNVKLYSGLDEAKSGSLVGDICQIADAEHVGIKLSSGEIEELGISAETFSKLFPDGCDVNVKQGNIGDCYLVASIYSMMSNPETSPAVLKCFTENADGSITVKIPEGSVEFTFDPGKITSDYVSSTKVAKGSEGVRMLEYVYGLELANEQTQLIQSALSPKLDSLAETNNALDIYKSLLGLEGQDFDVNAVKKMIDELPIKTGDKIGDFYPSVREEHFYSKFLTKTENGFEINLEYLKSNMSDLSEQSAKLTDEINDLNNQLADLVNNKNLPEKLRGNGGLMNKVFKKFGLDSTISYDTDKILQLLSDSDNWSNYIFGAGSKTSNAIVETFNLKKYDIASCHAYSIKPFLSEVDGSINIEITNPWHTSQHKVITLDEFAKYFDQFYYAKIK